MYDSGGNAGVRELWGGADEAPLTRPLLTSSCAVQFLTGHGQEPVHSPGMRDPCMRGFKAMQVNR